MVRSTKGCCLKDGGHPEIRGEVRRTSLLVRTYQRTVQTVKQARPCGKDRL